MLKAISIIAISKNLPLAVFMPLSKYAGSLIALPSTIPITNARSIALKTSTLLRRIADTAIAKESETPLAIPNRDVIFKI